MEKIKMMFRKNTKVSTMSQGYTAFTLAEVLITLGIIGVVAAMTIPTLMQNAEKQQTATQLKKVYTALSQATSLAIADNGTPDTWDWGTDFSQTTNTKFVDTYITPYFKIAKNCGYSATAGDCRPTNNYYLDKSNIGNAGYKIILQDGTSLRIFLDGATSPTGVRFWADLNGNKAPNVLGIDIFALELTSAKGKLILSNWGGNNRNAILNDTTHGCSKTATVMPGFDCGALIQMDNWEIKDDYPW